MQTCDRIERCTKVGHKNPLKNVLKEKTNPITKGVGGGNFSNCYCHGSVFIPIN